MIYRRRRRNLLAQIVALTFVLVICASRVHGDGVFSSGKLSHDSLRSAFSLKDRFKRVINLDSEVIQPRQKRFIYFRFKFPFGTNMEIKWAFNWLVPSEVKYLTRLQVALPINRLLPNYLVDDQYQPPFATLFNSNGREDLGFDDYYEQDEEDYFENESEYVADEPDYEMTDSEVKLKTRENKVHRHRKLKEGHKTRLNQHERREENGKWTVDDTETRFNKKKNEGQDKNEGMEDSETKLENQTSKPENQSQKDDLANETKDQNSLRESHESRLNAGKIPSKSQKPQPTYEKSSASDQNAESGNTEKNRDAKSKYVSVASGEENNEEDGEASRRKTRSLHVVDRKEAYQVIEDILLQQGLPGQECLLRTVCEVAEAPLHCGILGDFLNLLFTPSAALLSAGGGDADELSDYVVAEAAGRDRGECSRRYGACPSSMFDLVPFIRHRILDFTSPLT